MTLTGNGPWPPYTHTPSHLFAVTYDRDGENYLVNEGVGAFRKFYIESGGIETGGGGCHYVADN
jgi:hypothetical protein